MGEESNTNTKKPQNGAAFVDFIQKNALSLLTMFVSLILLYSNMTNDVGNMRKELRDLSDKVEIMSEMVSKLQTYTSRVDYLEARVESLEAQLKSERDMSQATALINATQLAEVKAEIRHLINRR
jgi:Tfp pilus assembly protein PilO